ncbi:MULTISPECIES: hypothetical protein [Pseudomonas]|uniref:hypothetical protein n=1 Tax=Pseudomonas TaxID=286 RepID=UPI000BA2AEE8|nr:hypothetical protein [Pseudomonas fragi]OZY62921.1 hypothetical protein CJF37_15805 [Pseudomonas fragi]
MNELPQFTLAFWVIKVCATAWELPWVTTWRMIRSWISAPSALGGYWRGYWCPDRREADLKSKQAGQLASLSNSSIG